MAPSHSPHRTLLLYISGLQETWEVLEYCLRAPECPKDGELYDMENDPNLATLYRKYDGSWTSGLVERAVDRYEFEMAEWMMKEGCPYHPATVLSRLKILEDEFEGAGYCWCDEIN